MLTIAEALQCDDLSDAVSAALREIDARGFLSQRARVSPFALGLGGPLVQANEPDLIVLTAATTSKLPGAAEASTRRFRLLSEPAGSAWIDQWKRKFRLSLSQNQGDLRHEALLGAVEGLDSWWTRGLCNDGGKRVEALAWAGKCADASRLAWVRQNQRFAAHIDAPERIAEACDPQTPSMTAAQIDAGMKRSMLLRFAHPEDAAILRELESRGCDAEPRAVFRDQALAAGIPIADSATSRWIDRKTEAFRRRMRKLAGEIEAGTAKKRSASSRRRTMGRSRPSALKGRLRSPGRTSRSGDLACAPPLTSPLKERTP